MAYTVTKYSTVFGNKRTVGLKITADAATQTIETGLKKIEFLSVAFGSCSTHIGPKIYINSNASGVQSMGVLGCSGFTSGDDCYVTVYGQ